MVKFLRFGSTRPVHPHVERKQFHRADWRPASGVTDRQGSPVGGQVLLRGSGRDKNETIWTCAA